MKTRIPQRFSLDPIRDIQVLCPMNRGGVGARSLNIELQTTLTRNSHTGEGVECGAWGEQASVRQERAADVCGEGWVAHEQHRQSGSVFGMYVDCAMSGSC